MMLYSVLVGDVAACVSKARASVGQRAADGEQGGCFRVPHREETHCTVGRVSAAGARGGSDSSFSAVRTSLLRTFRCVAEGGSSTGVRTSHSVVSRLHRTASHPPLNKGRHQFASHRGDGNISEDLRKGISPVSRRARTRQQTKRAGAHFCYEHFACRRLMVMPSVSP